jgi:cell division septation protein DedD
MSRGFPHLGAGDEPDAGDDEQPELAFTDIHRDADDREGRPLLSAPARASARSDPRGEPARSQFFRAKRGPILPVIGLVGALATVAFFLWLGRDEGAPPSALPSEELAPVAAAPDFEVPLPEPLARPSAGTTGSASLATGSEPDPSVAPPTPGHSAAQASPAASPAQLAAIPAPAAARAGAPEKPTAVRNAFSVQLLAARSEADVGASWEKLRGAYPELLTSLTPSVARTERAPGDTFYRLRAGPLRDRASADALCKALSARQQSCFVVSPGS